MKKALFLAALLSLTAACASAASVNGMSFKDHHAKLVGTLMQCETCHGAAVPTERPATSAGCIKCHGTMDKIPTKPNKFDKKPHASDHYGATLDCSTCHSEHKESRALCNDCHVVEWTNFK